MKFNVMEQIESSINIKKNIIKEEEVIEKIEQVIKKIVEIYIKGNKVIIAGNGGSAGDAQHMAGEFVNKFYFDRKGLPAIALTTDTSVLTAIGNDYGYDKIFSRQIQANGIEGDIFIGISTSGNSKNIIEAMIECKKKGITIVGLVGRNPCEIDSLCDYVIKVPSTETPRIQEVHMLIEHIICAAVEKEIFKEAIK